MKIVQKPVPKNADGFVGARVSSADLDILKKNRVNVSELIRQVIKQAAEELRKTEEK